MSSQLSLQNTNYFTQLQQKIETLSSQQSHIKSLSEQRIRKYEQSLTSYEHYLRKQTQVLNNNIKHSKLRNQFYLNEVKKAWSNGISNRTLVLRSLARTNVVKADAEEWINGIEGMAGFQRSNHEDQAVEDAELLRRYQDIVREFQGR